jgi:dihydrofolate synthase / folylpolyglutamate synthase
MGKTKWPGRMQWITWKNDNKNYQLLIDGAHNPAAAEVLRNYINSLTPPRKQNDSVNWVIGMLATKDHADIFQALLKPGDKLFLAPVPDSSSANLENLANLANEICPDMSFCSTYPDVFSALDAAVTFTDNLVVLCGSLYLIGHFLGNCLNHD